jgi:hypothetical protein
MSAAGRPDLIYKPSLTYKPGLLIYKPVSPVSFISLDPGSLIISRVSILGKWYVFLDAHKSLSVIISKGVEVGKGNGDVPCYLLCRHFSLSTHPWSVEHSTKPSTSPIGISETPPLRKMSDHRLINQNLMFTTTTRIHLVDSNNLISTFSYYHFF